MIFRTAGSGPRSNLWIVNVEIVLDEKELDMMEPWERSPGDKDR